MGMPRRTYLVIEEQKICLNEFYDNFSERKIPYNIFRQRAKKSLENRRLLSFVALRDAITMPTNIWVMFYGGNGKPFTYTGNLYPEYIGKAFHSMAAFLHTIGKYELYGRIKGRKNWDIDEAISKQAISSEIGRIYLISSHLSDKKYVGHTIKTIEERLEEHMNDKKSAVFQIAQELGRENIHIECLEDNIDNADLPDRENFYINKYNTLTPSGFNRKTAQRAKSGHGKEVIWQNKKYRSTNTLQRKLKKERPDLPQHVIIKRIYENKPLPEKSRKHSKHPESGTWLWRKWLALCRRNAVCPTWDVWENGEGYEQFKIDMGYPPTEKHKLAKKDFSLPHSKMNTEWLTPQEERKRMSGKPTGDCATIADKAKELGMNYSTATYHLRKPENKGKTLEQAISEKKHSTQRQPHEYDGIQYSSRTEMFNYIIEKYGITLGQAKDRYVRGLPFDYTPQKGNPCIIFGEHFANEAEARKHFEIACTSYYRQKSKGLSPEDAIREALKKKNDNPAC